MSRVLYELFRFPLIGPAKCGGKKEHGPDTILFNLNDRLMESRGGDGNLSHEDRQIAIFGIDYVSCVHRPRRSIHKIPEQLVRMRIDFPNLNLIGSRFRFFKGRVDRPVLVFGLGQHGRRHVPRGVAFESLGVQRLENPGHRSCPPPGGRRWFTSVYTHGIGVSTAQHIGAGGTTCVSHSFYPNHVARRQRRPAIRIRHERRAVVE